jgi:hypothetical protein
LGVPGGTAGWDVFSAAAFSGLCLARTYEETGASKQASKSISQNREMAVRMILNPEFQSMSRRFFALLIHIGKWLARVERISSRWR